MLSQIKPITFANSLQDLVVSNTFLRALENRQWRVEKVGGAEYWDSLYLGGPGGMSP